MAIAERWISLELSVSNVKQYCIDLEEASYKLPLFLCESCTVVYISLSSAAFTPLSESR